MQPTQGRDALRPLGERQLDRDDPLEDFEHRQVALDGVTKTVHVAGNGPAVIIMPEMPGISPHLARFARWVRAAGFSVYLPSLFGRDGAVPQADEGAAVFRRVCVSAEFNAFAAGRSSPATAWLRALARQAHRERGGAGVGAVGMCFTGNFALTLMLEPAVLAPVLAQPSLPLNEPGGLEISPGELHAVRERLDRDDLTVLAYRFRGDQVCRADRFAAYAAALGERFDGRELPDSAAATNPPPFFETHVPYPHSVLTVHLVDEAGPTLTARDEVIAHLTARLRPTPGET